MVAVAEREMAAKKVGRPASGKPSNEGKLTRLDSAVVAMGKAVAASRGIHLSEYFSEMLRGPVGKEYAAMLRELEKGTTK